MILNICIHKQSWISSRKTRDFVIIQENVKFIWIGMYIPIFMTTREYLSKSNNNFCNFAAMHKTISMCNWHFLYRTYIHFQMGKCNLNSTYFYLHYNRKTLGHIQNGNIIHSFGDLWIKILKLYNTIFCMLLHYIIKQKDYN